MYEVGTRAGASTDAGPAPPERWSALAVLCLCFFCVAFDNTKLVAATPTLARAWGIGGAAVRWVVLANLLVYVSLLLLGGALSERLGPRRVLLAGLAVFGVGSLLAAAPRAVPALLAARAVTGVGGALMTPASLAAIKHLFREPERPRAIAIWSASYGIGAAVGPPIAGLLLERWGFGSMVLANLPGVSLALVGVRRFLPAASPRRAAPLDPGGAGLAFAATASLLFAILEGPALGWGQPPVLVALGTAAGGYPLLWAWQRRARHPMLDPTLFRRSRFRVALLVILLSYLAYAGVSFVIAQYLQSGRSYAPTLAGVLSMPLPASMLVGTLVAPPAMARLGAARALATALLVAAVGAALLAASAAQSADHAFCCAEALFGAGCGAAFVDATEVVVGSVPPDRAGSAAAINETTFEFGGAVGVAVLGAAMGIPALVGSAPGRGVASLVASLAADRVVAGAAWALGVGALSTAAAAIVAARVLLEEIRMPSVADQHELRELVRRHRVTWESRPELAAGSLSPIPIGFVVELSAAPDHAPHAPLGACPDCDRVADALERLVHAVVEDAGGGDGEARAYTLHVGRGRIQVDPGHDSRPEVAATITLLHPDAKDRGPAEADKRRLDELQRRLRALGSPERHWDERAAGGGSGSEGKGGSEKEGEGASSRATEGRG